MTNHNLDIFSGDNPLVTGQKTSEQRRRYVRVSRIPREISNNVVIITCNIGDGEQIWLFMLESRESNDRAIMVLSCTKNDV